MKKDQTYSWQLCEHSLMVGNKGETYCRALHMVGPLEVGNCEECPLWNGLAGRIGCVYYDFKEALLIM